MDAFTGYNLMIDEALQQQLQTEGTKWMKFSLKPTGLTTLPGSVTKFAFHQEHPVSLTVVVLLLSGWVITALVAHVRYEHI